jgi:hypothetical protein
MKIQKGKMLIQDMGLKKGEIFQMGVGPKAFQMKYAGTRKRKGKIYDVLVPVK